MSKSSQFYIDGRWVDSEDGRPFTVRNPANDEALAEVTLAGTGDVDRAVEAAVKAFEVFSSTSVANRIALLGSVLGCYQKRLPEVSSTITLEMGSPRSLSEGMQAPIALGHLAQMIDVLKRFDFETVIGNAIVVREPIGVCALVTPWNWPIHQVVSKVIPALAAGCTVVLKPSEFSPLSAILLTEILHEAGVPQGVFNLINGDARTGQLLAEHPHVDMISFTGSTRAGIDVAQRAAVTVKRVHQELGGKAANILLPDVDFESAVEASVRGAMLNSGQNCNAPTRLLVPEDRHDEVARIAARVADSMLVGEPEDASTELGPLINERQFERVQRLIKAGLDEGAALVAGGFGRPRGLAHGHYARPTVFARVTNDMTIAREEIFGPVLSIIAYRDEEDAIRIANDTETGLAAYISSSDAERAGRIARRLRVGNVHINGAPPDLAAPFGGYKKSGNGREFGEFGLDAFLEHKAVLGANSYTD